MAWVCWVYRVSGTRVLYFKLYSIVLLCVCACMHAQLLSYVQLFVTPMDCRPPGFSVHGIFQARILEWIATSSSRGSSRPSDQTRVSCVSCIGRWILYHWTTWQILILSPWIKLYLTQRLISQWGEPIHSSLIETTSFLFGARESWLREKAQIYHWSQDLLSYNCVNLMWSPQI